MEDGEYCSQVSVKLNGREGASGRKGEGAGELACGMERTAPIVGVSERNIH